MVIVLQTGLPRAAYPWHAQWMLPQGQGDIFQGQRWELEEYSNLPSMNILAYLCCSHLILYVHPSFNTRANINLIWKD